MSHYILTAAKWLDFTVLLDYFRDLKSSYQHHLKVRSTVIELSKLSDRELRDIGITRGDIYAIAHGDDSFTRAVDHNTNLNGWV